MELKSVGHFKEMSHGSWSSLSIREYIYKESYENIDKICSYLESGIAIIVSPELTEDVLAVGKCTGCTSSEYTDGTWVWPGDLAYYVRNYNLALPAEFKEHMKKNDWTIPVIEKTLDNESLVIDGNRLY